MPISGVGFATSSVCLDIRQAVEMDGKKGAPRKSHKKSRKGCRTCVRRHIRCDETLPCCHNCKYRNLPCYYTSKPPKSPLDASPDSSPSPRNQQSTNQGFTDNQTTPSLSDSSANHIANLDIRTNHGNFSHLHQHLGASNLLDAGICRIREIGSMDPFNALPITANPHIYSLLNHLDKFVRHSRGLPGPREKWISFAISDSAVLPMLLFISALDIAGLRGKSDSRDIIYWKGETIRTINARLGDTKKMATDGTIAAIASLAHLENLAGTAESARIHAAGLETLVRSRGGLENLGEHDMTRRIVAWSDICTSIILERKPRYSPISINKNIGAVNRGSPSTLVHSYKAKIFELTKLFDLSEELIALHEELRTLSYLKERAAYFLVGVEDIDNIPFTDTAEHLERRLVPLTQLEPLSNLTQTYSIYIIFGYASLIHLYLFIRDCSKDLPFSHLLSCRIRTVLEKIDTQHLEAEFPELMLWIYIMGGLSGNPSLERAWFANRVACFCHESGLSGADQIKDTLENFLWSELYRSPVTEGFWAEVANKQGCVVGYEVRRMPDCVSLVYFNAPADLESII